MNQLCGKFCHNKNWGTNPIDVSLAYIKIDSLNTLVADNEELKPNATELSYKPMWGSLNHQILQLYQSQKQLKPVCRENEDLNAEPNELRANIKVDKYPKNVVESFFYFNI